MARVALITLCVIAVIAGARGDGLASHGMTMASRAFKAVCWYEALKAYPLSHGSYCGNEANDIQDQIDHPAADMKHYLEVYPDAAPRIFTDTMAQFNSMSKLPDADVYNGKCGRFLEDRDAQPTSDQSGVLNDDLGQSAYPLKAFAYCLMETLHEKHGDEALDAVRTERTHPINTDWHQTFLDRDNLWRKRHGTAPLQLRQDLVDGAQKYADQLASTCVHDKHSPAEMRTDRNGNGIGENICAGGGDDDDKRLAAYICSNSWYNEYQKYYAAWPQGYSGNDSPGVGGHFTQTVWNETQYVGYGYANNHDCPGDWSYYVVAWHYPQGNVDGEYMQNVLPPLY